MTSQRRHLRAKPWLAALATVAALGMVVGCTTDTEPAPDAGGETSGDGELRIAFLNANPDTTYAIAQREGATEVAEAGGATIEYWTAEYDPGRQQSQCDSVLADGGYDGLLIVPVSHSTAIPCIEAAAAAGIPVASVEGQIGPEYITDGLQMDGLVGQIYLDPEVMVPQWAEMAVDACAEIGADPCNIGLLTGDPEYPTEGLYLDEWDKQLEVHPELEIVAELAPGYGDPNAGISAVQNLLQTAPEVNVIMVSDDQTGDGVAAELERQGLTGEVILIGQGATVNGVQRIADGVQYGSIVNVPRSAGASAMEMLLQAINGETIENPSRDFSQISPLGNGNVKLTIDNVEGYVGEYE